MAVSDNPLPPVSVKRGVQTAGRAKTLKERTKENHKMSDKWAPPRQDMAGSSDISALKSALGRDVGRGFRTLLVSMPDSPSSSWRFFSTTPLRG